MDRAEGGVTQEVADVLLDAGEASRARVFEDAGFQGAAVGKGAVHFDGGLVFGVMVCL